MTKLPKLPGARAIRLCYVGDRFELATLVVRGESVAKDGRGDGPHLLPSILRSVESPTDYRGGEATWQGYGT